ncbi:PLP-dependent aminotransferase family protein [Albimonas sp. CAU 1670]|uniref:aminotransferase-like domain-containing protein n=1 Tax=Albimonas sp. CAU 1670 TaxID=3032599 RepID=UPI0023DAC4D7|nr:PLP-dependent aminotransferase family protein [Albimonas sp. CAU 1670]MDF2231752.1 PLP-dependent aminotransferase family protein [Albimonas sp. CAU 1670]
MRRGVRIEMAGGARTTEAMQAIRRRIDSRALAPGERLPSIRRFAQSMGLSPSTVVEAYDRLAAEGLIRSRPGSGFYVCGTAPSLDLRAPEPPRMRELDPFWVSRQSLDAGPEAAKPGCGWLPADWMPQASLRRALRELARGPDALLADYGAAAGPVELRRMLARQAAEEGLDVGPEAFVLTASGSQSLDLVCRCLLRPGDAVLVDDPCYFNFQALLRVCRARVVSVPMTPTGPDLAAFAAALEAHRPRLYLTNAALHNPTGATLSPQAAHRVLTLAAAHDLTIVEDETFAALEPDPSPRLAALDGLERVIRVGTFSKTLTAAARVGYVAGGADLVAALTDLQVATNFGGPSPISAELVRGALADGSYRKHLDGLRRRLSRARKEVTARLADMGIAPWLAPRGGFLLWCVLPEGIDSADLARAALREGVVLAPGDIFSPAKTAAGFMRVNVAQMTPPAWAALERAMAEVREA